MVGRRIILGVAIVSMSLGLVFAGGFFGSGDSTSPLDPTNFGAGTADAPYCHEYTWTGHPNC